MTIKRWLKTPKNLLNRWLNPVPPQIFYSFRFVLRVSLKLFLTEIFFHGYICVYQQINQRLNRISLRNSLWCLRKKLFYRRIPRPLRCEFTEKELAMQRNIRSEARRRRVSASQSPSAFGCSSVTIVEKLPHSQARKYVHNPFRAFPQQ